MRLRDRLREIQDVNQVDCLYLVYLDEATERVVYLVDAAYEDVCLPGSCDELDGEDYLTLRQPERGFGPSVTISEAYGWNVGTGMPVFDDDGDVLAYLGVDLSMTAIVAERNRLLLNTALTVMTVMLVFGAVGYYVMRLLGHPEDGDDTE